MHKLSKIFAVALAALLGLWLGTLLGAVMPDAIAQLLPIPVAIAFAFAVADLPVWKKD